MLCRPEPWARRLSLLLAAVTLGGCASQGAADRGTPGDPFEPVNRVTYKLNDVADLFVLRPIAVGYERITPAIVRTGVNNFFDNLGTPVDIVNAFLQGKFRQGLSDTGRFALNSTLGLAGILDPASDVGLAKHDEDFGQTLGVWGFPEGPYLVVPFFGPRTLRHGAGQLVDVLYHPQTQYDNSSVRSKVNILWIIHERSRLLGIDEEVRRAFDPYAFVRDSYLQNRRFLRYDGELPEEDFDFGEDFEDEFADQDF